MSDEFSERVKRTVEEGYERIQEEQRQENEFRQQWQRFREEIRGTFQDAANALREQGKLQAGVQVGTRSSNEAVALTVSPTGTQVEATLSFQPVFGELTPHATCVAGRDSRVNAKLEPETFSRELAESKTIEFVEEVLEEFAERTRKRRARS